MIMVMATYGEINKYDIMADRKIEGFYKIDKLGNEEKITEDEFLQQVKGIRKANQLIHKTTMNKKGSDESDLIVDCKTKIQISILLKDLIVPLIIDIIALLIILKLIKRNKWWKYY